MRNSKWFRLILFFCIFFFPSFSFAEDLSEDVLSITVVKYKMTDSFLQKNPYHLDGSEIENLLDDTGKKLEPVEGILYQIERVTPNTIDSSFKPVVGKDALKVQVKTNKSGIAEYKNLQQGMYKVTELPDQRIKRVMEPVILELPLPRPNSDSLKNVYIYPKSSVTDDKIVDVIDKKDDKSGFLPKTSGNLGNYSSILGLISFVFLLGITGIYLMHRKEI